MGIEDDVYRAQEDVRELERKFERFVCLARAAFGDPLASESEALRAQLEERDKRVVHWNNACVEANGILREVAEALGVHGSITREKLLRAAQRRRAKP